MHCLNCNRSTTHKYMRGEPALFCDADCAGQAGDESDRALAQRESESAAWLVKDMAVKLEAAVKSGRPETILHAVDRMRNWLQAISANAEAMR